MSVSRVADDLTGRRGYVRLAAGAAALLSGLAAGSASAVLLDSFTWNSDNARYNAFAATCPNKTPGETCGINTPSWQPQYGGSTTVNRSSGSGTYGSGILFSWGTDSTADQKYNTTLTWINDGVPFTLDQLVLTGNGPVGTGAPKYNQGTGASPPWEWATTAHYLATWVAEAHLSVSVGGTQVYMGKLFDITKYANNGKIGWFAGGQPNTLATPIDFTALLGGIAVGTGQSLQIRLFERCSDDTIGCWDGRGSGDTTTPDVQYAPLTVRIYASGDAPVPATLALLGLGLPLLRLRHGSNRAKSPVVRCSA